MAQRLEPRLRALGLLAAVLAGALSALVSLHFHVPPWVASLRGFATLLAVAAAARVTIRIVVWSCDGASSSPPDTAPR
jgi:hypothetical protein